MCSRKHVFKLSDYDAVALDFDNTLVQYNLTNLFQFHYSYWTKYLIEKKGYNGLQSVMNDDDIDFIRRGLFMDFKRGNVLDVSAEGLILTASHGTKKLSKEEIIRVYGSEMRWSATDLFIQDKLALWEGPASEETRTFLDYTDIAGTLVFAKAIDLVDKNKGTDYNKVWLDLLEAIVDMYKTDSDFTETVLNNMEPYIYKCNSEVIKFLKKLKENGKSLLITGNPPDLVKKTADYALGTDWEKLFHTIVYCAKKPAFFTSSSAPFLDINGHNISLKSSEGIYKRGNWSELYKTIECELGKAPKCVYLGDSTVQDVYAPYMAKSPIDSIAVIEEALSDNIFPGEHSHQIYLRSNYWGSYFGDGNKTTVMGDIIQKYSKLCVPSVSYLAAKPLDYEHIPFWLTDN